MSTGTQSKNLVERILRRRRPGWLQILDAPNIEITQADIMRDLDPGWSATAFDETVQSGGSQ